MTRNKRYDLSPRAIDLLPRVTLPQTSATRQEWTYAQNYAG